MKVIGNTVGTNRNPELSEDIYTFTVNTQYVMNPETGQMLPGVVMPIVGTASYETVLAEHRKGKRVIMVLTGSGGSDYLPLRDIRNGAMEFSACYGDLIFTVVYGSDGITTSKTYINDISSVSDEAFEEKLNAVLPNGDEVAY